MLTSLAIAGLAVLTLGTVLLRVGYQQKSSTKLWQARGSRRHQPRLEKEQIETERKNDATDREDDFVKPPCRP